ncbi:MAG: hypothetical protein A2512_02455 [Deltaproteobacteria bacterium RIFOXYD12_FULL_56_24]|nr:MAG: hypothetical protein A2512_02455 [Deltaproteobacteria bacterium RIFOXYD12_FULL_56_24]
MTSEEKDMPGKKLVDFEEFLRAAGLKMTPQLMMICREIIAAGDHPSVETLFYRVRQKIPCNSYVSVAVPNLKGEPG